MGEERTKCCLWEKRRIICCSSSKIMLFTPDNFILLCIICGYFLNAFPVCGFFFLFNWENLMCLQGECSFCCTVHFTVFSFKNKLFFTNKLYVRVVGYWFFSMWTSFLLIEFSISVLLLWYGMCGLNMYFLGSFKIYVETLCWGHSNNLHERMFAS